MNFGHHRLSVFGIADEEELALIKPVARALLARDALRADDYGGLSFGPAAKPILKGEEKARARAAAEAQRARRDRDGAATIRTTPCSRRCAPAAASWPPEAGVPPYVIFHDSTLREMAELKPTTLHALSRVSGVGAGQARALRRGLRRGDRGAGSRHDRSAQLDEAHVGRAARSGPTTSPRPPPRA